MLWVGGFLIVLYLIVQVWFGEYIALAHVKMRLGWLKAITFVWEKENLMAAMRMIETRHVREITGAQLSQLSSDLRFFMFPLFAGFIGWYAWGAIKKNPSQKFKRVLGRKDLAIEMSKDFPWALPALQQDLIKASIHKGRWAMALTPLQFARKYALLNGRNVDTARAEKLFSSQLGKLWTGPKRLPPATRAIFACFAAQVCRDKKGANDALRELVISISSSSPVWTKSNALLKKYADDPRVLRICNNHAYQYTVMISMFDAAKKIGVFPPNFFLWLRPRNRKLWLVLNCVLSRTYFCEVSGIYAHYLAEIVAGHKIEKPFVSKAVDALELALRDMDWDTLERRQAEELPITNS